MKLQMKKKTLNNDHGDDLAFTQHRFKHQDVLMQFLTSYITRSWGGIPNFAYFLI